MDGERELWFTEASFQEEVNLLVRFGMRRFSNKYFEELPNPPMADNIIKDLVHSLIELYQQQKELTNSLNSIAQRSTGYKSFHKSLLALIEKINDPNAKSTLKWELASDFLEFYKALLERQIKSLDILGMDHKEYDNELNNLIPKLKTSIDTLKPEGAKDTHPINLNIEDPKVATDFNAFVASQMTKYSKCIYCHKPATYFSYPCSDSLTCDEHYSALENIGTAKTKCIVCNNERDHQIVHIPPKS